MRRPERPGHPGRRHAWLPLVLAAGLGLGLAHAASPVLEAFGDSLAKLPAPQRAQLQARAAQWEAWTDAEREAFRQRAAAWAALSPQARAWRREQHAAWQGLTSAEQAQLRVMAARWQQLDPARQQAWRSRFDALDRSEQRGWLLGPTLGADYPRLQPLLAQVPASDRAPLLRVLREMTPPQRSDLAVLVQRTPPQDRPQLRRELLSTAAAQRQAWLWQRLDR
ncbi:DUF3106 domain-containing protein [Aerolutibacter ruishenii]|uniref:Uncharacterized protein DUF3106 n=1 Tax=Aerolutibacter ruishenii TaxID=686800 RepID=A0A562LGH0_9GAMM|nr:DUF3106 domain-containing protein [Lysobacter ruishenii]TWI06728.1 uncharacterized protein DUF3106 [Lysobacter ruishenii]